MPNRHTISKILRGAPLNVNACQQIKSRNFFDHYAAALFEALAIDGVYQNPQQISEKANPCVRQSDDLSASNWIDARILDVFRKTPHARGIEIDSGLSTRFHRLSHRLDWPRFTWLAINTHKVDRLLQRAFPPMDNYKQVACERPFADCYHIIDLSEACENILIVGEQQPLCHWPQFENWLINLEALLRDKPPGCDLLVCHRIAGLYTKIQRSGLRCIVKGEYATRQSDIWKSLRKFLFSHHPLPNLHCCHLYLETTR